MFEKCPCGVGASYLSCCAQLHHGQREAETPEQLMRARYSAYARCDAAYLLKTWSLETRPADLGDLGDRQWLGLILEDAPPPKGDEGIVQFTARFKQRASEASLRERSHFLKSGGRWFYVKGEIC